MLLALLVHIILTTMSLCYLSKQLRAHGLAIVALAKALTLTIERKQKEEQKWN